MAERIPICKSSDRPAPIRQLRPAASIRIADCKQKGARSMDTGYCHREAKRTDSDKRRMNSIGKLRFRNCFRIFAVAQADFAAQDADP